MRRERCWRAAAPAMLCALARLSNSFSSRGPVREFGVGTLAISLGWHLARRFARDSGETTVTFRGEALIVELNHSWVTYRRVARSTSVDVSAHA